MLSTFSGGIGLRLSWSHGRPPTMIEQWLASGPASYVGSMASHRYGYGFLQPRRLPARPGRAGLDPRHSQLHKRVLQRVRRLACWLARLGHAVRLAVQRAWEPPHGSPDMSRSSFMPFRAVRCIILPRSTQQHCSALLLATVPQLRPPADHDRAAARGRPQIRRRDQLRE